MNSPDYNNYFNLQPDRNGRYGKYGGTYLPDLEKIGPKSATPTTSFRAQPNSSRNCAPSANTSRDAPPPSIMPNASPAISAPRRFTSSAKTSTTPAPTN